MFIGPGSDRTGLNRRLISRKMADRRSDRTGPGDARTGLLPKQADIRHGLPVSLGTTVPNQNGVRNWEPHGWTTQLNSEKTARLDRATWHDRAMSIYPKIKKKKPWIAWRAEIRHGLTVPLPFSVHRTGPDRRSKITKTTDRRGRVSDRRGPVSDQKLHTPS